MLLFLEDLLLWKAAAAPMLTRNPSESLERGGTHGWFLAVRFLGDIEMHRFCLLTSMKLTSIAGCSLFYLHSNDMNSSKQLFLKKCYGISQRSIG